MLRINQALGKWMPDGSTIAVDSTPWKLHGILDTIASATAHSEMWRYLPAEFFNPETRRVMERICAEEEFAGYVYSQEFRTLGVGKALAETVQRMSDKIQRKSSPTCLCLFGCHDSTIAGFLASLGAMADPDWFWPPYAAFVSFELYRATAEAPQDQRWYVQMSYMGSPLKLPMACQEENHFPGDETLCTFVSKPASGELSWKSSRPTVAGEAKILFAGILQESNRSNNASMLETWPPRPTNSGKTSYIVTSDL